MVPKDDIFGAAWVSAAGLAVRLGSMAARFGLLVFLGKNMPAGSFGEYGLLQSSLSMGVYLLGLDLYVFTTRELPKQGIDGAREVLKNQFMMHLAAYLLIIPLALPLIAGRFIPHGYLALFAGLLVLEHITQEIIRALVALQRPLLSNLVILSRGILWICAFVIACEAYPAFLNVGILLVFWICGLSVSLAIGILVLFKVGVLPFKWFRPDFIFLRDALKASASFLFASVSWNSINLIPRYFLKYYGSPAEVGALSFYQGIADIIELLLYTAFVMVLLPKIIKARDSGDACGYRDTSALMFGGLLYGSVAVTGAMLFFARPFFLYIGKPEMTQPGVFAFLIAAYGVNGILLTGHYAAYICRKDRALAASAAAGALADVLLCMSLIPKLGLAGGDAALGDDEFAAVLLFDFERAFQGADGRGGLVVRRRLGSNALQPQSGRHQSGHETGAPFGGEADGLIAQAGDQGQGEHADGHLGGKRWSRYDSIDGDGNHHHHQQEAGAAARVPSDELLGVFDGEWLVSLETENGAVFAAMVLEDPVNVLPAGYGPQEAQEDDEPDEAVSQIEQNGVFERRDRPLHPFSQDKRYELVEGDEEKE
jgi:O-antigen/teichoic acid export membrane protein